MRSRANIWQFLREKMLNITGENRAELESFKTQEETCGEMEDHSIEMLETLWLYEKQYYQDEYLYIDRL